MVTRRTPIIKHFGAAEGQNLANLVKGLRQICQAMLIDRLIHGVAQFDASAFTMDHIPVGSSSDARTLTDRLRVVNRAALERGFLAALPTIDDDESAGTIGVAFYLPAAADALSVPANLLKK